MKTYPGIVDGKSIVFSESLGLPDGTAVRVQLVVAGAKHEPGEGLARCAGALADTWTAWDDQILKELERGRNYGSG